MSDNTDLKPCPFCGSKAYVCQRVARAVQQNFVFVKCRDCRGQTAPVYSDTLDQCRPGDYEYEAAIALWNRRVSDFDTSDEYADSDGCSN